MTIQVPQVRLSSATLDAYKEGKPVLSTNDAYKTLPHN